MCYLLNVYTYVGGEIVPNTGFGTGTGEILASNISCNGTEYDVYACQNTTDIPDVCTHERDAALSCQPGFSEFFVLMICSTKSKFDFIYVHVSH